MLRAPSFAQQLPIAPRWEDDAYLSATFTHSVLPHLPTGSRLTSIRRSGKSMWNQTYEACTSLSDKEERTYFLKIATVKNSNAILLGEWESLLAIQRFAPNLSPRPVARGNWGQVLHENFLLFEYHDLNLGPADFTSLPVAIAKLHRDSQGSCNEFGFVRPTYHGWMEQCNPKMKSWEAFFSDALNDSFRLYKRVVGETRFASIIDHEMEIRIEALLVRVVPRLLRSLDTGPHAIQPTLLHGDLWQGNFALDKATLRPIIFDPCSFWGHNEYDIAEWGPTRSNIGDVLFPLYHAVHPISYPEDEFHDRIALYALRFNLHDGVLFPQNESISHAIKQEVDRLVQKYGND